MKKHLLAAVVCLLGVTACSPSKAEPGPNVSSPAAPEVIQISPSPKCLVFYEPTQDEMNDLERSMSKFNMHVNHQGSNERGSWRNWSTPNCDVTVNLRNGSVMWLSNQDGADVMTYQRTYCEVVSSVASIGQLVDTFREYQRSKAGNIRRYMGNNQLILELNCKYNQ